MQYTSHYQSPIGNILLAADEIGLTGLWFEESMDASKHEINCEEKDLPIFRFYLIFVS